MKKAKSRLLQQAAVFLSTLGACIAASAGTGPYVGLEIGINSQADQHVDRGSTTFLTYDFKRGDIYGVNFGYATELGLRPEIAANYRKNDFSGLKSGGFQASDLRGDENLWDFMGNLWYDVRRPEGIFATFHPYVGGGFGYGRLESHQPTFTTTSFLGGTTTVSGQTVGDKVVVYQGGAGVGWDATPATSLSLDYRHLESGYGTFETSAGTLRARYRADAVMVGLRHSFGEATPPPPPPPAAAPEPVVVQPVDSDGDGVMDDSDKCPNTPKGFKVDAAGCIIEQSIVLRGINFVFDSDQLTQPAQETLDEVAAALVGQPTLTVQIVGHTDNVGSEQYNNALSQKRADAVRTYLVGKSVKPENLQAHGAGESTPISDNESEEGRAENRRVEFIVVDKPADVNVKVEAPTEQSKTAAEAGEPAGLKKGGAAQPAAAPAAAVAPADVTPAAPVEATTPAEAPMTTPTESAAPAEAPTTTPTESTAPAEATPAAPAESATPAPAETTSAGAPAAEAAPTSTDTTTSSPSP